jgi:carboxymethylenebutenolidase
MERKQASDFDQRLLDLYDEYAHGRIARREFGQRARNFLAAGMTIEALLAMLSPNYAWAQQVAPDDSRIVTQRITYNSPQGGGDISGLLVMPATPADGRSPAVLVIHENRGLNPYIEDVARRLATAGFLAFAPDALSPLGGYPGTDDEGRTMQAKRKPEEMLEDFMAGARFLQTDARSTGKVGAVGFCYGGGVVNELAVRLPNVIRAGVPFYGRQPASDQVGKIKAAMLMHYAELDQRINDGWPAYEAALKAAGTRYQAYFYPGVNHGFHNDTTPRFDKAAAELAWQRTIEFFHAELG